MTNVTNLFPCKWSSLDAKFACNIVRLIADDLRRRGYEEAADQAAGWIIPFLQKANTPAKQEKWIKALMEEETTS